MGKELSEMALEELWQLFPIYLTEHKEEWCGWYTEEATRIGSFLEADDIVIHHIGSTAIKEIWAKPIVDILVEIPKRLSMKSVRDQIINHGYLCMSENENRMSFNRGYTKDGFAKKVFHLHLRYIGDNDEIYFCEYLNDNPTIAKQYERLKLALWKKYEHNRDAYTEAKGEFVRKYTEIGKNKTAKNNVEKEDGTW